MTHVAHHDPGGLPHHDPGAIPEPSPTTIPEHFSRTKLVAALREIVSTIHQHDLGHVPQAAIEHCRCVAEEVLVEVNEAEL